MNAWHEIKTVAFWLTLFAMFAFAAIFMTLYEAGYRECADIIGANYSLGECTIPDTVAS